MMLNHNMKFRICKFGRTYFRDVYPGVSGRWYHDCQKEFNELSDIDSGYYHPHNYDVGVTLVTLH